MATPSSTLAWKIPWMEEPGGLPSLGLHRVGHDWSHLAAAAAAWIVVWRWCSHGVYSGEPSSWVSWGSRVPACRQAQESTQFLASHLFSSVQFSRSVVSDSLRPHEPQHTRPLCPSPTPGVHPNPCPLSRWCHPTISSSVVSFSSCPQSFPASGSFQMSQIFTSGGQSIGISVSASVLPLNIQDWFCLGWTGWISLLSKGLSSLLKHYSSKASVLQCSAFFIVQVSHPYITCRKTIAWTIGTFVSKVMSLRFNILSRFVIAFLPRSKGLLILWLHSPSEVILEPK